MKRILLFVIVIFLVIPYGSSQITFEKVYGGTGDDWALSGQPTSDGGYVCFGTTKSFGAGSEDFYLVKLDQNGISSWTRTYGGTQKDQCKSGIQTSDGGYIICGFTESFGAGMIDIYLVKTNSNGDTIWTKTYGGSSDEVGMHVIQLPDGSYVLTGDTKSYGNGNKDMFLIKTNSSGTQLWFKTYGRLGYDLGNNCIQTSDGGFIILGMTDSYGAGNLDLFLVKTDQNGDSLWSKTYGGSLDDFGGDIKQTSDGGYIFTGITESFGAGSYDVYLIRTDSVGDTLWTKTFGGQGVDNGNCVIETNDGGYAIIGSSSATLTSDWQVKLIKTDANGIMSWYKYFGGTGTDYSHSIHQTSDGGYFITGTSYYISSLDFYAIKTDANGDLANINEVLQDKNKINIYPNPCNYQITVNLEEGDHFFEIADIKGRIILKKEIEIKNYQESIKINLGHFDSGIYYLKFTGEKGIRIGKIIKI